MSPQQWGTVLSRQRVTAAAGSVLLVVVCGALVSPGSGVRRGVLPASPTGQPPLASPAPPPPQPPPPQPAAPARAAAAAGAAPQPPPPQPTAPARAATAAGAAPQPPEAAGRQCVWQGVAPAADAGYERGREGRIAPRLDRRNQTLPAHEKFKVSYCFFEGRMSGKVRIVKHAEWCNASARFSDDAFWAERVAREHGPDDFQLTLEGWETQALVPVHRGQCEYEASFHVTIPGRYRLGLVATREFYMGAEELTLAWPAQHYDLPIGTAVYLQLGDGGGHTSAAKLAAAAVRGEGLPQCDLWHASNTAYRGRWVYTGGEGSDPLSEPNKTLPVWDRGAVLLTSYVDWRRFVWRPWRCALQIFDQTAARRCLEGKRFAMIGDSHMRVTFRSFVRWICNATFATDRSPKYSGARACAPQPFGQCSNSSMCFIWEPSLGAREGADACGKKVKGRGGRGKFTPPAHCLGRRSKRPANFMHSLLAETRCLDLTIINAGHQPASGEYRWHFARYRKLVEQVAALRHLYPALAWRETNSMPFRKDHFVQQKHDRRTEARLRMWSTWARERLRAAHLPVLPSFWATNAFVLHTEDNSHFPPEMNWALTTQQFLNLLCPPQGRPPETKPPCAATG